MPPSICLSIRARDRQNCCSIWANQVQVRAPGDFGPALDALTQRVCWPIRNGRRHSCSTGWSAGGEIIRASILPIAQGVQETRRSSRHAARSYSDGAALSRFLAWFARAGAQKGISRDRTPSRNWNPSVRPRARSKDVSFDSISGAGPHGRSCHYRVHQEDQPARRAGPAVPDRFRGAVRRRHNDVTRTVGRRQAERGNARPLHARAEGPHPARAGAFPRGHNGGAARRLRAPAAVGCGLDTGTDRPRRRSYLVGARGPQSISPRGTTQALRPA